MVEHGQNHVGPLDAYASMSTTEPHTNQACPSGIIRAGKPAACQISSRLIIREKITTSTTSASPSGVHARGRQRTFFE